MPLQKDGCDNVSRVSLCHSVRQLIAGLERTRRQEWDEPLPISHLQAGKGSGLCSVPMLFFSLKMPEGSQAQGHPVFLWHPSVKGRGEKMLTRTRSNAHLSPLLLFRPPERVWDV